MDLQEKTWGGWEGVDLKARLVAKGYTQRQGVDFEEIVSHVAMFKSISILLAIATWFDYEVWQMDVKTVFLKGDIKEQIYMSQPEGFTSIGSEHMVCKLQKSIYGLKQALGVGTSYLMVQSKSLVFLRIQKNLVCIRKSVEVL